MNGLLITFLPAVLLLVLGDFGTANTTFGDTDFGWFGILVGYGAGIGSLGGLIVVAALGLLILGAAILVQVKVVNVGWDPSPHRSWAGGGDSEAPADGVAPLTRLRPIRRSRRPRELLLRLRPRSSPPLSCWVSLSYPFATQPVAR